METWARSDQEIISSSSNYAMMIYPRNAWDGRASSSKSALVNWTLFKKIRSAPDKKISVRQWESQPSTPSFSLTQNVGWSLVSTAIREELHKIPCSPAPPVHLSKVALWTSCINSRDVTAPSNDLNDSWKFASSYCVKSHKNLRGNIDVLLSFDMIRSSFWLMK